MPGPNALTRLGQNVRMRLTGLGRFTRFFFMLLQRTGIVLQRPRLVSQQVHFIGNFYLLIIIV